MRVHVVDGTFELFRAHLSERPDHTAPSGKPMKATLGVAAQLLALLHDPDESPTHVAVAFDNPFTSFRNDMFDGYKTGEGVDPVLTAQLDDVEDAVRALGLRVWSMKDLEADDALATASRKYACEVRLVTPDKDLGQCLDGTRVVLVDRIRRRVTDEAAFRARRGFGPASMPDYLALVGDPQDGIPGIPGFGEKTAGALLGAFEHLEGFPHDPGLWKVRSAPRLAATLRERWDDAMLYRDLATVRFDAPIDADPEALRYKGTPRAAFYAWCEEVGANDLRDRPRRFV